MIRKNANPERDAQVSVKGWLELVLPQECIVFAVPNEHQPKSKTAKGRARFFAMRREQGVKAGFPDLGILFPEGKTLFIEMKAPVDGILSAVQNALHSDIRALKHNVIVATSIETARGGLLRLGIKLREPAGQMVAVAQVRVGKPRVRRVVARGIAA